MTNSRHQTSVTAGTIFHNICTPLQVWFCIIFLVTKDKRSISALSISKEFPASYPTTWTVLHKIRKTMNDRNSDYQLSGVSEVDEGHFATPTKGPGIMLDNFNYIYYHKIYNYLIIRQVYIGTMGR